MASDAGAPLPDGSAADALAFSACTSVCVRPRDCQVDYADDGYCPAGFLCAQQFHCLSDGGLPDSR